LLIIGIGLSVGIFGTLIGVAGGFLLVPILLFLHPDEAPDNITSITLVVAFFNALSGSIAYGRLRRIDLRSGILFSLVGIPGSIIGAVITFYLSRGLFQIIFGVLLLLVAAYLIIRPIRRDSGGLIKGDWQRQLTDKYGNTITYNYRRSAGIIIAFFVGIVSGLLGIGGGIIHVPILTQVLGFPVHIATATSQFVVSTTTLAASITHTIAGNITNYISETLLLAAGAIIGAQVGAHFSHRVPGRLIIRLLAVALMIVAIRLLVSPL
jgi:uncharacterized membrane protein YfcA